MLMCSKVQALTEAYIEANSTGTRKLKTASGGGLTQSLARASSSCLRCEKVSELIMTIDAYIICVR